MILISGGLGFIGSHTARALDLGRSCVLTQHRRADVPDFLEPEVGRRINIEQLDWTDTASVLQLGNRHEITSIIHLAAPALTPDRIGFADATTRALLNTLRAGREWGVARVAIASSVGLYSGVTQTPFREDLPLPMITEDPIPVLKRAAELLAGLVAHDEKFELTSLRISTIWGPLGPPDTPFLALPHLVHAAAHGTASDLSRLRDRPYADDGADLCYVKDCARAIALLTTAETLSHRTYNVGDGRSTSKMSSPQSMPSSAARRPRIFDQGAIPPAQGKTRTSTSPVSKGTRATGRLMESSEVFATTSSGWRAGTRGRRPRPPRVDGVGACAAARGARR
jgi:UDP-glucose 4-epimerase